MTNRIQALTVTLSDDIREDDLQSIMVAVAMIKGVGSVNVHVADVNSHVARQRAKAEIREKLFNTLEQSWGDASG